MSILLLDQPCRQVDDSSDDSSDNSSDGRVVTGADPVIKADLLGKVLKSAGLYRSKIRGF